MEQRFKQMFMLKCTILELLAFFLLLFGVLGIHVPVAGGHGAHNNVAIWRCDCRQII